MAIDEMISLFWTLLPYLNSGMTIITINLALRKMGFAITPREFKRKPGASLILGLGLVFISSVLSLFVQAELSEFGPPVVFLILLALYYVVSQTERKKKKRR